VIKELTSALVIDEIDVRFQCILLSVGRITRWTAPLMAGRKFGWTLALSLKASQYRAGQWCY